MIRNPRQHKVPLNPKTVTVNPNVTYKETRRQSHSDPMLADRPTPKEWYIFRKYIQNHRKLWAKTMMENTLVYQGVFHLNNKYIELYFNINIQIVGGNLAGFDDDQHIMNTI